MHPKVTKNKEFKKHDFESIKQSVECEVSKASKEIMLDRFYNGNRIEFPFAP